MSFALQLTHHAECRRSFFTQITYTFVAVPIAPQKSINVICPETAHGVRELALKGEPSHLTIGDDVEISCLLQCHGLIDCAILDCLELRLCDCADSNILLCLE